MASSDRLPTLIDIRRLRVDGGTQHRAKTNGDVVAEYCEAYLEDKKMPPVRAVFDGENFWLWDGFHRIAGAREAGKKGINVDVTRGTQRDAFLLSLGANEGHGLRRSNEDKRNAVRSALQDTELAFKTDREIARICGVGHELVASMRKPAAPAPAPAATTAAAAPAASATLLHLAEPPNVTSAQLPLPEVAPAPQPPEKPAKPPKAQPVGALEEITRERDEWKEQALGAAADLERAHDEIRVLTAALKLGNAERAFLAEIEAQRKRVAEVEERMGGMMAETAAAVKSAKHWRDKALGYERAAKKALQGA